MYLRDVVCIYMRDGVCIYIYIVCEMWLYIYMREGCEMRISEDFEGCVSVYVGLCLCVHICILIARSFTICTCEIGLSFFSRAVSNTKYCHHCAKKAQTKSDTADATSLTTLVVVVLVNTRFCSSAHTNWLLRRAREGFAAIQLLA